MTEPIADTPSRRDSGGDDVQFRPIQAEDEEFLYRLYASTREEELAPTGWTNEQKEAFLRMQFEAQSKQYRETYASSQFSIILKRGEPIGRWYVGRWKSEFRIIDITLLPEHRNSGIGGRLMRDFLAEAGQAGKPVRIHVEKNNPAMHLYHRLGFQTIKDKGVYDLMEWSPDAS